MRPDADLSLAGLAVLVDEFLERLDLHDVTLVQNDWGGAQVMWRSGGTSGCRGWSWSPARRSRIPARAAGRALVLAARVPAGWP